MSKTVEVSRGAVCAVQKTGWKNLPLLRSVKELVHLAELVVTQGEVAPGVRLGVGRQIGSFARIECLGKFPRRAAIVPIYKKRGPLPAQLVGFVSGHGGVAIVWGCCCEAEKREGRGARGAKDRASGAVCAWCWALPFFRRSREEATPILNHVEL